MRLRLGYVPLTDAAAMIAAAERGFARAEGLTLELSREASWATLRDRLALGHLDGAHILAPLAVAVAAGLSGPRAALSVPFALNLNGNAITLSSELWAALSAMGPLGDVDAVAAAFAAVAHLRARTGRRLTLATVFPYSSHTYQLRLFAARGGLALDDVATIVVIPPPQMVDALRRGTIDGFCVGAPWNAVAVAERLGRIAAFGSDLAPDCPEKVLAVPASRGEAEETFALVRALQRAADWCAEPGHHADLAALLAEPRHLAIDPETIRRSLDGKLRLGPGGPERIDPRYLVLGGRACRPERSQAAWIRERMTEAGQIMEDAPQPAVYRPDLYDAAFR
jgi:two-component system, oxyanion-binding sensor